MLFCRTSLKAVSEDFFSKYEQVCSDPLYLFAFTKEILQQKFHFLCNEKNTEFIDIHAFFYKQHFYKQRQTATGKKLSKS